MVHGCGTAFLLLLLYRGASEHSRLYCCMYSSSGQLSAHDGEHHQSNAKNMCKHRTSIMRCGSCGRYSSINAEANDGHPSGNVVHFSSLVFSSDLCSSPLCATQHAYGVYLMRMHNKRRRRYRHTMDRQKQQQQEEEQVGRFLCRKFCALCFRRKEGRPQPHLPSTSMRVSSSLPWAPPAPACGLGS